MLASKDAPKWLSLVRCLVSVFWNTQEGCCFFDISDHVRRVKCLANWQFAAWIGTWQINCQWAEGCSFPQMRTWAQTYLMLFEIAFYHLLYIIISGGKGEMSPFLCSFVLEENLIWKALNVFRKVAFHLKGWQQPGRWNYSMWKTLEDPPLINCDAHTWACSTKCITYTCAPVALHTAQGASSSVTCKHSLDSPLRITEGITSTLSTFLAWTITSSFLGVLRSWLAESDW